MEGVNSSHQREHLPTSCSEVMKKNWNGSLLSYIPTPLFLSVLCHLAIVHESVRLRRLPTTKETKIYRMQASRWVTNKGTGSKIRFPAAVTEEEQAGWGSCEGSARFAAGLSFLPLFSSQDTVPQCHGGGESHTGCFCCVILPVTHKLAKREKNHSSALPHHH